MLLDEAAPQLEAAAVNSLGPAPRPLHGAKADPGVFDKVLPGAGMYFMRGMAEAGRAMSMAGAAVPVAIDAVRGGTELQDEYFRSHDATFQRAVDYWTPKPQEVGAAGQVVGQLSAGILQFLASPSLMVATNMLSTSEDLVRQGVPADAAVLAGDVAGLSTVAGIALPIFGKTLGGRVATGAAGNLATNIPEAAIKREIVSASGNDAIAAQFDPWDAKARTVDVLLGAVFGAKAHVDARFADSLMVVNSARHIEDASSPGAAPDVATRAVDNTKLAMDQLARGEQVNVPPMDMPDVQAARAPYVAEMEAVLREAAGEPVTPFERPPMLAVESAREDGAVRFADDIRLPTGDFDAATGAPRTMSANDLLAKARQEADSVRQTASQFMQAAATCLLGGI